MAATPLVELRGIPLAPAEHGSMIDVEPALQQASFDITVAEGIAEIPSHPTHNNLGSEVVPLEQGCGGHRRTPLIESKGSPILMLEVTDTAHVP
jgi:hypothetical protein